METLNPDTALECMRYLMEAAVTYRQAAGKSFRLYYAVLVDARHLASVGLEDPSIADLAVVENVADTVHCGVWRDLMALESESADTFEAHAAVLFEVVISSSVERQATFASVVCRVFHRSVRQDHSIFSVVSQVSTSGTV